MIDVDIAAIKRLAEAATPGPWKANDPPTEWATREGRIHAPEMPDDFANEIGETLDHHDAAYIAAVSPDVVLALVERLERAENPCRDHLGTCATPLQLAQAKVTQFEKQIAKLTEDS